MPNLAVNGVSLHYETHGAGPEVFISAQMRFGSFAYQRRLSEPPRNYRVYLVTLRGYGESTHVFEDLGHRWYDVWADDVFAFAQALGIEHFIYTGHSHGAGVGWHLALRHPEVLKGFISVAGAPHDRAGGDVSEARRRTLALADNPALIEELFGTEEWVQPGCPADPRQERVRLARAELREALKRMRREELLINPRKPIPQARTNEELAAVLSSLQVPTLIMAGDADDIIPVEMTLLAGRSVPRAKTVIFQGCGHQLPAEVPEHILGEIELFVRELNEGLWR